MENELANILVVVAFAVVTASWSSMPRMIAATYVGSISAASVAIHLGGALATAAVAGCALIGVVGALRLFQEWGSLPTVTAAYRLASYLGAIAVGALLARPEAPPYSLNERALWAVAGMGIGLVVACQAAYPFSGRIAETRTFRWPARTRVPWLRALLDLASLGVGVALAITWTANPGEIVDGLFAAALLICALGVLSVAFFAVFGDALARVRGVRGDAHMGIAWLGVGVIVVSLGITRGSEVFGLETISTWGWVVLGGGAALCLGLLIMGFLLENVGHGDDAYSAEAEEAAAPAGQPQE